MDRQMSAEGIVEPSTGSKARTCSMGQEAWTSMLSGDTDRHAEIHAAAVTGGRRNLPGVADGVSRPSTSKRHHCPEIGLVRRYLQAGMMEGGLVSQRMEGTPQGGPLSPLLSNIILDELDKELEKRGHAFCRYADDCNIYVRSKRAGERVMRSVSQFLATRLKLRVNPEKSAVERPGNRKGRGESVTFKTKARLKAEAGRDIGVSIKEK
jgi:hypothetical protein